MATPLTPAELRKKAMHYRTLAAKLLDPRAIEALHELAAEYEAQADMREKVCKREEG